jgi:hypothetical protein
MMRDLLDAVGLIATLAAVWSFGYLMSFPLAYLLHKVTGNYGVSP